jgi:hypothetical protein
MAQLKGISIRSPHRWQRLTGKVLSIIVYQATPRDPMALAGILLTMPLVSLLAGFRL